MRPVSVPTREQSVRPMRGARRERRELAFLAGGMGMRIPKSVGSDREVEYFVGLMSFSTSTPFCWHRFGLGCD